MKDLPRMMSTVDERRELLRRKNICFHCFRTKEENHEVHCKMKDKNICKAHPDDSPSRFHHFTLCHARQQQFNSKNAGNNAVMVSQVDGNDEEQEHMVMMTCDDQ